MILCKSSDSKKTRDIKTINISIDEMPHRPEHKFKSTKERIKFIKGVEMIVRGSMEYREYIRFLRENMDMNRCAVLQNIMAGDGKKYSIEIHHEPFTLYAIVETILDKYEDKDEFINPYTIAEEVMELHYEGKVGLIPLSTTQHQLVHDGQIFIPLQQIYQDYHKFYEEYEPWISSDTKDLLQFKVDMSMKCEKIQSDVLDPTFVYVNIDGFDFPSVPDEWKERKKSIENPDPELAKDPPIYKIGMDMNA